MKMTKVIAMLYNSYLVRTIKQLNYPYIKDVAIDLMYCVIIYIR